MDNNYTPSKQQLGQKLQQKQQKQLFYASNETPAANAYGVGSVDESASKNARRLPSKGFSMEKDVDAVVITVVSGGSYDDLYRTVEQEAPTENSCVHVFELQYGDLETLFAALSGREKEGVIGEICDAIARADADSVCCKLEWIRAKLDWISHLMIFLIQWTLNAAVDVPQRHFHVIHFHWSSWW
jgi:hypothetical protein